MDFSFSPESNEAAALAAQILGDRTGNARLKEVEAGGDRLDLVLWQELAAAGLTSLHLPEAYGGAGLGLLELCRVLVEVGRTLAPVPLAVHGAASLAIAELGTEEQKRDWLFGAAAGERDITVAISEEREGLPTRPSTTATRTDDGWVINGLKTMVRSPQRWDLMLVTASTPTGAGVFLVEQGAEGVTVQQQRTSDGDTVGRADLTDVRLTQGALLGAADGEAAQRLEQLLVVATCAEQFGTLEGALKLTSEYAKTREQFGRAIGTFQAVSQRLADGYIDVLGAGLALWEAAWRLDEGLPAEVEVASAKLWAADAGHKLAHTTVHVHGGVGIDLDGEAHRYFTAAKRNEFLLGSATDQARRIGRILADEPV